MCPIVNAPISPPMLDNEPNHDNSRNVNGPDSNGVSVDFKRDKAE